MSANFYATFSQEGMRLLREGKVYLKSGGLRRPDGTLYELANLILPKPESDLTELPGVQKKLEKIAAQCAGIQKNIWGNFEKLSVQTNQVAQLTKLNTAISFGNAVLSVVETAVICNKLDGLKEDIKEMDSRMQTVYKSMLLSQTEEPFCHYITRVKNDLIEFDRGDYYYRFGRDINNLLGDVKEYLCKIRNWFETGEMTTEKGESACNIIFTLLPLYSRELVEVCRNYVKLSGMLPPQYDEWSTAFSAFAEDPFQSALKRFLAFGHPELSLRQKAAVCATVNWTIANIMKEQINNIKLCTACVTQGVKEIDEVEIQPICLDDLKLTDGMVSI